MPRACWLTCATVPHQVISAVSVLHLPDDRQSTRINTTTVTMRDYNDEEIAAYVATGDPLDKAGAYAIQARDFNCVTAIDGCYASVMGLPLADLRDLLAEFGVTTPANVPTICGLFNTFACCRANHHPRYAHQLRRWVENCDTPCTSVLLTPHGALDTLVYGACLAPQPVGAAFAANIRN